MTARELKAGAQMEADILAALNGSDGIPAHSMHQATCSESSIPSDCVRRLPTIGVILEEQHMERIRGRIGNVFDRLVAPNNTPVLQPVRVVPIMEDVD